MAMDRYFYCRSTYVVTLSSCHGSRLFSYGRGAMGEIVTDAVRTTTELIASDSKNTPMLCYTGTAPRSASFTAYGHTENAPALPTGFKGERCDRATSWYLLGNGFRAYNPSLMRFNSPDRFSPFDSGGINAYAFVSGNPVSFDDPTGRGIGEFIMPELKISGGFTHFGKPRKNNPKLKDIIVTNSRTAEAPRADMTAIIGHGNGHTVGGLTPQNLVDSLKSNSPPLEKGPIHLISCYAGANKSIAGERFPDTAFGQALSNITNKPVITYTLPVLHFKLELTRSGFLVADLVPHEYMNAGPVTFYPDHTHSKKPLGKLAKLLSNIRDKN